MRSVAGSQSTNICPISSHSSECGQSHDVDQLANVSLYSFQQMDASVEGGEEAGQGFTQYTHPAVVAGQAGGKACTKREKLGKIRKW